MVVVFLDGNNVGQCHSKLQDAAEILTKLSRIKLKHVPCAASC